jgi:hypothetical protein
MAATPLTRNCDEDENAFDDVYRFRCNRFLKQRADRVTRLRGYGDKSDLARESITKLIEGEEHRLGIAESDQPSRSPQLCSA